MKKIKYIGISTILMFLFLSGCGAKTTVGSDRISTDNLLQISIQTEGNPVRIYATDDKEVHISAPGYEQEWVKRDGEKMVVRVPSPAGIHLKKPGQVEISIPKHSLLELSVETDSGNVVAEHAFLKRLDIKTSVGDIKLVGLSGQIQAKTNVGRIETQLPIQSSIVANPSGVGKQLNDILGESSEESIIDLYTETGDIILE